MVEYGESVLRQRATSVIRTLGGTRGDWRLHTPQLPRLTSPSLAWTGPVVLLAATFVGWFAFLDVGANSIGDVALALFVGSVSILFMAWSNVLSTRWRVLEPFFGGLDRMYRWHRWFGALSVAAMWLHIQTVDDVKGIRGASKDVADAAEDLAGLGEKVLYVLVIASFVRWVPYRWWRQSHKLLIVPFVLASWHFHTATKPYANSSAWGRWFQALMVLGIVAWVYRVVWCDGVRRGRRYTVQSVDRDGSVTELALVPVGRPMKRRAGQFVFVRVGTGPLSEPHPFTIASDPRDPVLRLLVKDLGDWSKQLSGRVDNGDEVLVEGPYGRLRLFPHQPATTVWIAGGVGITPFLSGMRAVPEGHPSPDLFFAVRSRADAPGLADVERAHLDGRIELRLHVSEEDCRLCGADLEAHFGPNGLAGAHVVMCGPDALVRDMARVVRRLGARDVHVEAFDIRTGVGPDLSQEVGVLVDAAMDRRRTVVRERQPS